MGSVQCGLDVVRRFETGAFADHFAGDGRHILEILAGFRRGEFTVDVVAVAGLERELDIQV